MTKEQMDMAKRLTERCGIKVTDTECALIFIGIGYGLSEMQIEEYMKLKTSDLLEKHERMLCMILGLDSGAEDNEGIYRLVENPVERLEYMLREHFTGDAADRKYGVVMQFIIRDSELSAAQIEQLRQAVEAGMPEKDVMEMATKRKEVMEMRRCIEFYEMMKQSEKRRTKRGL